jgi:hypothetical protein
VQSVDRCHCAVAAANCTQCTQNGTMIKIIEYQNVFFCRLYFFILITTW